MDLWHSLGGMVCVELTAAEGAQALERICKEGITVYDVQCRDGDIVSRMWIGRSQKHDLECLAQRRGWELKILGRSGLYWFFRRALSRPVLTVGAGMLLTMAVFLSGRILFIRVEGNAQVPTRLILEKSAQCGIRFGASRKDVRSQKIKDALLYTLPELRWAGINTAGCVATITVRERSEEPPSTDAQLYGSIIAGMDGTVTELTVLRGSAACQVGQQVKQGDKLISGIIDCGLKLQYSGAQGEVYAQTQRDMETIYPDSWTQEGEITDVSKKYTLVIGKKRINFSKMSGNSGITCDKIYEENYVTLPGGFVLPIAIVTEVRTYRQTQPVRMEENDARELLKVWTRDYLQGQMVAGRILDGLESVSIGDDAFRLEGKYVCNEMIGQAGNKEIGLSNGNDHRTDR